MLIRGLFVWSGVNNLVCAKNGHLRGHSDGRQAVRQKNGWKPLYIDMARVQCQFLEGTQVP